MGELTGTGEECGAKKIAGGGGGEWRQQHPSPGWVGKSWRVKVEEKVSKPSGRGVEHRNEALLLLLLLEGLRTCAISSPTWKSAQRGFHAGKCSRDESLFTAKHINETRSNCT